MQTMRRLLRSGILFAAIATLSGWSGPGKAAGVSSAQKGEAYLEYWEAHYLTPAEYVVQKFRDKKWVFLGEYHRVKHDMDLVNSLIPLLHAGTDVRHLALEFLCHRSASEANALITAQSYDRDKVIDFFRRQFPAWAYEEYLQLFKSGWESNQKYGRARGPFRLVGLNACASWEIINYGAEAEAVKQENEKLQNYDLHMARYLESELLSPGKKALVHTGIAHSTAKHAEFWLGGDKKGQRLMRMGNLVYKEPYKKDMVFICLHAPFYDSASRRDIYPFDGTLDRLMKTFQKDIGFDILGSPFESLSHKNRADLSITQYAFGELYDGYIIFKTPIKEYMGVTCIPEWITDEKEFRHFWRNLANKEASEKFSLMPFEEFKKDFCSPNADHGVNFRNRFRRLPEIDP
jgi:hypothetical protein